MRRLALLAAGALAALCQVASFTTSAPADDMQMTTCPAFASVRWVSPMPPNDSGSQYQVTVTQKAMSCAEATQWAQKLIAQHVDGKPMMPSYPPPTGGPAGYICKGSPDNTGHAYRGHCLKQSTATFAPGFNWTNHPTP